MFGRRASARQGNSKARDESHAGTRSESQQNRPARSEPLTDLVLVNKRIRSRDVFKDTGTFMDVAKELWKKYKDTLTQDASENVDNLIADEERMPIRFQYVDAAGSQCLIEPAEPVAGILAAGAEQVIWDHVPIGGDDNFRQLFGAHALELIKMPQYLNWTHIYKDHPGYGITATGPDKDDVVRTLKITPSGDYPNSPPTVVSEPAFKDDPCWAGGLLHFTEYSKGGGSAWKDLVDASSSGINPLQGLIMELLTKYKFAV